MGLSAPSENDVGADGGSKKDINESPNSIMNRRRAAKLPSSFSSNLGNRNSPLSSPLSRNDAPSECEVPNTAGGRSVKSIVRWIEASEPAAPASPKSVISKLNRNSSTDVGATAQKTCPTKRTIPHAPGVEDHSLAYLNYKRFFTEAPFERCLDGVTENLAKIPLDTLFNNASNGLASEKTRVSLFASANDVEKASCPAKSGFETEIEESGTVTQKSVDMPGEILALVGSQETDSKTQGQHESADACIEQMTTPGEDEAPRVVYRDPREVLHFWGNIRSYMHISYDELENEPAASNEQLVALSGAVIPRYVWGPRQASSVAFGRTTNFSRPSGFAVRDPAQISQICRTRRPSGGSTRCTRQGPKCARRFPDDAPSRRTGDAGRKKRSRCGDGNFHRDQRTAMVFFFPRVA